ncbi:hypothetical protein HHSLTHF2_08660 [Vreelandella venusta]|uniref:Uncharacterized protein n=1 Tax=Halomonas hydrothermalis TaxID=115561 RepID=A0A6F8U1G1_9GAMM|nr:hypothetical protein [Halomonas hydrothermalis]BCB06976.1 hypothetical protein HHSLTHF2_08660 [Halomonas hydrothermalis]
MLAGIVLDWLGYPAMFAALALGMAAVTVMALLGGSILQSVISQSGEVR